MRKKGNRKGLMKASKFFLVSANLQKCKLPRKNVRQFDGTGKWNLVFLYQLINLKEKRVSK